MSQFFETSSIRANEEQEKVMIVDQLSPDKKKEDHEKEDQEKKEEENDEVKEKEKEKVEEKQDDLKKISKIDSKNKGEDWLMPKHLCCIECQKNGCNAADYDNLNLNHNRNDNNNNNNNYYYDEQDNIDNLLRKQVALVAADVSAAAAAVTSSNIEINSACLMRHKPLIDYLISTARFDKTCHQLLDYLYNQFNSLLFREKMDSDLKEEQLEKEKQQVEDEQTNSSNLLLCLKTDDKNDKHDDINNCKNKNNNNNDNDNGRPNKREPILSVELFRNQIRDALELISNDRDFNSKLLFKSNSSNSNNKKLSEKISTDNRNSNSNTTNNSNNSNDQENGKQPTTTRKRLSSRQEAEIQRNVLLIAARRYNLNPFLIDSCANKQLDGYSSSSSGGNSKRISREFEDRTFNSYPMFDSKKAATTTTTTTRRRKLQRDEQKERENNDGQPFMMMDGIQNQSVTVVPSSIRVEEKKGYFSYNNKSNYNSHENKTSDSKNFFQTNSDEQNHFSLANYINLDDFDLFSKTSRVQQNHLVEPLKSSSSAAAAASSHLALPVDSVDNGSHRRHSHHHSESIALNVKEENHIKQELLASPIITSTTNTAKPTQLPSTATARATPTPTPTSISTTGAEVEAAIVTATAPAPETTTETLKTSLAEKLKSNAVELSKSSNNIKPLTAPSFKHTTSQCSPAVSLESNEGTISDHSATSSGVSTAPLVSSTNGSLNGHSPLSSTSSQSSVSSSSSHNINNNNQLTSDRQTSRLNHIDADDHHLNQHNHHHNLNHNHHQSISSNNNNNNNNTGKQQLSSNRTVEHSNSSSPSSSSSPISVLQYHHQQQQRRHSNNGNDEHQKHISSIAATLERRQRVQPITELSVADLLSVADNQMPSATTTTTTKTTRGIVAGTSTATSQMISRPIGIGNGIEADFMGARGHFDKQQQQRDGFDQLVSHFEMNKNVQQQQRKANKPLFISSATNKVPSNQESFFFELAQRLPKPAQIRQQQQLNSRFTTATENNGIHIIKQAQNSDNNNLNHMLPITIPLPLDTNGLPIVCENDESKQAKNLPSSASSNPIINRTITDHYSTVNKATKLSTIQRQQQQQQQQKQVADATIEVPSAAEIASTTTMAHGDLKGEINRRNFFSITAPLFGCQTAAEVPTSSQMQMLRKENSSKHYKQPIRSTSSLSILTHDNEQQQAFDSMRGESGNSNRLLPSFSAMSISQQQPSSLFVLPQANVDEFGWRVNNNNNNNNNSQLLLQPTTTAGTSSEQTNGNSTQQQKPLTKPAKSVSFDPTVKDPPGSAGGSMTLGRASALKSALKASNSSYWNHQQQQFSNDLHSINLLNNNSIASFDGGPSSSSATMPASLAQQLKSCQNSFAAYSAYYDEYGRRIRLSSLIDSAQTKLSQTNNQLNSDERDDASFNQTKPSGSNKSLLSGALSKLNLTGSQSSRGGRREMREIHNKQQQQQQQQQLTIQTQPMPNLSHQQLFVLPLDTQLQARQPALIGGQQGNSWNIMHHQPSTSYSTEQQQQHIHNRKSSSSSHRHSSRMQVQSHRQSNNCHSSSKLRTSSSRDKYSYYSSRRRRRRSSRNDNEDDDDEEEEEEEEEENCKRNRSSERGRNRRSKRNSSSRRSGRNSRRRTRRVGRHFCNAEDCYDSEEFSSRCSTCSSSSDDYDNYSDYSDSNASLTDTSSVSYSYSSYTSASSAKSSYSTTSDSCTSSSSSTAGSRSSSSSRSSSPSAASSVSNVSSSTSSSRASSPSQSEQRGSLTKLNNQQAISKPNKDDINSPLSLAQPSTSCTTTNRAVAVKSTKGASSSSSNKASRHERTGAGGSSKSSSRRVDKDRRDGRSSERRRRRRSRSRRRSSSSRRRGGGRSGDSKENRDVHEERHKRGARRRIRRKKFKHKD